MTQLADLKKFLKKFTLFCILGLIALYALGKFDHIIERNNVGNIYKIRQSKNYDSLDYLVIGDSYGYSDISCDQFDSLGLRYYNLSQPAASVYYFDLVLNDYLKNCTAPPKHILMLMTPIMFADVCDVWEDYTVHRNLLTPLSNEQVFFTYHTGFRTYSMLTLKSASLGLQNILFKAKGIRFEPEDYFKDTRGYLRRPGEATPHDTLVPGEPWNSMKKRAFMTGKFQFMLDMLAKLKAQHVDVILYEVPTHHTEKFFTDTFMRQYEEAVSTLTAQGYKIIRKNEFSYMLKLENFADMDHMNSKGAAIYTEGLLQRLYPDTTLK